MVSGAENGKQGLSKFEFGRDCGNVNAYLWTTMKTAKYPRLVSWWQNWNEKWFFTFCHTWQKSWENEMYNTEAGVRSDYYNWERRIVSGRGTGVTETAHAALGLYLLPALVSFQYTEHGEPGNSLVFNLSNFQFSNCFSFGCRAITWMDVQRDTFMVLLFPAL